MIKTYAYKDIKIDKIFAREEEKSTVADVVAEIITDVRKNGDAALKSYCEKFDGAAAEVLEVSAEERAAVTGSSSTRSAPESTAAFARVSLSKTAGAPRWT